MIFVSKQPDHFTINNVYKSTGDRTPQVKVKNGSEYLDYYIGLSANLPDLYILKNDGMSIVYDEASNFKFNPEITPDFVTTKTGGREVAVKKNLTSSCTSAYPVFAETESGAIDFIQKNTNIELNKYVALYNIYEFQPTDERVTALIYYNPITKKYFSATQKANTPEITFQTTVPASNYDLIEIGNRSAIILFSNKPLSGVEVISSNPSYYSVGTPHKPSEYPDKQDIETYEVLEPKELQKFEYTIGTIKITMYPDNPTGQYKLSYT